jgi:hypothetical protein
MSTLQNHDLRPKECFSRLISKSYWTIGQLEFQNRNQQA